MIESESHRIATLLRSYLKSEKQFELSRNLLVEIVQLAYYSSMKSDESRRVNCTLTFVDSSNPAGDDPKRVRPQRRTYVPFEKRLALTCRNLVKLAHAAPPWAACIAVTAVAEELFIVGLFDQEIHHRNALNHEQGDRFDRPGLFQIEISGIGALAVLDDNTLIATLSQDTVVQQFHDVLRLGPVSEVIREISRKHLREVKRLLKDKSAPLPIDLGYLVAEQLIKTLARILLSMKRSGHGGALLLTPRFNTKDLRTKYTINYDKLDRLIPEHVTNQIIRRLCDWVIAQRIATEGGRMKKSLFGFREDQLEQMPLRSHSDIRLAKSIAKSRGDDVRKGQAGGVAFVSGLAQVDGLILLAEGAIVHGFGVEITCAKSPKSVLLAHDEKASQNKLTVLDYSHFGTRHRSMMRYCNAHKGAVGFVISQDGDIRAMTKLGESIVVWENLILQEVLSASPSVDQEDQDHSTS